MRHAHFARYAFVVLIAASAACSAGAPAPTPTPPSTIQVTLSDNLRIEPASMTVQPGVPITFVVTNAGALDHEFYLGSEQMQLEHAAEMAAMGGMMAHDEENGIAVAPGQTKELVYTFEVPGEWLAGCHVLAHYDVGMLATITITD